MQKNKTLFINILIIFFVVAIVSYVYASNLTVAYAKPPKATETVDPYAPPIQMQEAYIPPTMLAPTPSFPSTLDELYAYSPGVVLTPGIPYVWGYFTAHHFGRTYRAFWVTINGIGRNENLEGTICADVMPTSPPWDCKILLFMEYYPQTDTNLYYSPFFRYCNKWFAVVNANFGMVSAEIRQPNQYFDNCVILPTLNKGG